LIGHLITFNQVINYQVGYVLTADRALVINNLLKVHGNIITILTIRLRGVHISLVDGLTELNKRPHLLIFSGKSL